MNKLIAVVIIAVFVPFSLAQAAPENPIAKENPIASGFSLAKENPQYPVLDDYQGALADCVLWKINFDNPKFYKTLAFKDEKTGVITKFNDLSNMEKKLYFLYNAEQLSVRMAKLKVNWGFERFRLIYEEIQKITRPTTQEGKKVATKEDVEEHIKRLNDLRKQHAVIFEKLIDKVFEEFKNEIPENDRKSYVERIHKWHNTQKLIERNKDKNKNKEKKSK